MRKKSKFQIQNPKQIQNSNFQNSKHISFGYCNFGHWNLFVIWCLVLGILILSGCVRKQKEVVEKTPVRAVKVRTDTLQESLFYVGDIKAKDEATVYPKVTGKIIEKLAKEGDQLKRGDMLAYIDRDEVGFQFQKAPVESPIDGLVGSVYIDVGTNVSPLTPIGLVVNMDVVKVKVNIVERDLPKVKEGQLAKIKVDAYPDEIFEGVVERVSPVVDLASRTALVEIIIPNSDYKLKPGMFARIRILINEKKDILIIPRDAIIRQDSSNYVFVVKDDNEVYRQKIEIGLNENNKFEVIGGLNEGESVVIMGKEGLKQGDVVEIVE